MTQKYEAIGWTIFGVALIVGLVLIILIIVPVTSANETERIVACIEAGKQFIAGTCT